MRFKASPHYMRQYLIIVDYKYYLINEEAIIEWATKCTPGWKQTGMVLEFKSEEDRLAFLLRWD